MAELAARIRDAESEVKKLVDDYNADEDDEELPEGTSEQHDLERNARHMDEGSDDDGESDVHSLDALEEKWNELEVSPTFPVQ